jgi:hypothetical protein
MPPPSKKRKNNLPLKPLFPKPEIVRVIPVVVLAVWATGAVPGFAALPVEWQHEQHFGATNAGLIKIALPRETLNAGRPDLEDLRLYDEAGNEVPYLIQRPRPVAGTFQNAKSFHALIGNSVTLINVGSDAKQAVDAILLETPAFAFIKAVRVEGSSDGKGWQTIVEGQPIFRQASGAEQLRIPFPAQSWSALRLTLDDQRSAPVPITGARLHLVPLSGAITEKLDVKITTRTENPGETQLLLNIGAANLDLASLHLATSEPLFTRKVTVLESQIRDEIVSEIPLAESSIYRVELDGRPTVANLEIPIEARAHSRELTLMIQNQDNPPLRIQSVTAEMRPVYVIFRAREPGTYHLLTGNSECPAPRYDLSALERNLKTMEVTAIEISSITDNPGYHPPKFLGGVAAEGAPINVSDWRFRKSIRIPGSGVQQLEIDLQVLAHGQPGLGDLRLVRAGKQVPYLLYKTSAVRSFIPQVTASISPKDAKVSRWTLSIPFAALPVTRIACQSSTALFERDMSLWEELADERGEKTPRPLGQARWVQTSPGERPRLVLELQSQPFTDSLILETQNGDNPPISLTDFKLLCPVTKLLFNTDSVDGLYLYYGNDRASAPRYDLGLVAAKLLAAAKQEALAAPEEGLKGEPRGWFHLSGKTGTLFWISLALVVVVLLIIISKLLPKPTSQEPAKGT